MPRTAVPLRTATRPQLHAVARGAANFHQNHENYEQSITNHELPLPSRTHANLRFGLRTATPPLACRPTARVRRPTPRISTREPGGPRTWRPYRSVSLPRRSCACKRTCSQTPACTELWGVLGQSPYEFLYSSGAPAKSYAALYWVIPFRHTPQNVYNS